MLGQYRFVVPVEGGGEMMFLANVDQTKKLVQVHYLAKMDLNLSEEQKWKVTAFASAQILVRQVARVMLVDDGLRCYFFLRTVGNSTIEDQFMGSFERFLVDIERIHTDFYDISKGDFSPLDRLSMNLDTLIGGIN